VRAVIIADTHVPDGSGRSLDEELLAAVEAADLILHAGDVTGGELLDRLGELAPVHAVLGNNDVGLAGRLPEELVVDVGGVRVGMVHDAGPREGRAARLARRFPDADLVVFGHSHQPEDVVPEAGPRIFNPGSPTQRRRAPTRTFGVLDAAGGAVASLRHVHLAERDGRPAARP
jgi:putative phosphoesterase